MVCLCWEGSGGGYSLTVEVYVSRTEEYRGPLAVWWVSNGSLARRAVTVRNVVNLDESPGDTG